MNARVPTLPCEMFESHPVLTTIKSLIASAFQHKNGHINISGLGQSIVGGETTCAQPDSIATASARNLVLLPKRKLFCTNLIHEHVVQWVGRYTQDQKVCGSIPSVGHV